MSDRVAASATVTSQPWAAPASQGFCRRQAPQGPGWHLTWGRFLEDVLAWMGPVLALAWIYNSSHCGARC